MNRWRRIAIPTLLAAAAALAGCHNPDENHPTADIWPDQFFWEAELVDFSRVEHYTWNTPFERAGVEFEGWDYDGSIRLEIFDDDDVLIYDRTFVSSGGQMVVEDRTDVGNDGNWRVRITVTGADGHVHITLF